MHPFLFVFLLLLPGAVAAQDWRVLTHSLAGQAEMVDGALRGKPDGGKRAYFVELVRAMLAELGQPARIEEVPLARGLVLLLQHENIALFNVDRTAEREERMAWVGPIWEESDYLYERAAAPTGIHSLADARPLRVCVLNASAHDALLARAGFAHLYRHSTYVGCFQMLALGRVDLVASGAGGLEQKLRAALVESRAIRATPVRLASAKGYIGLSPGSPAAEVARWNGALAALTKSGARRALLQRYAAQPE